MKIKLNNVFVDDQDKALKFYTEVLGFVKKTDIPAGKFKWLTVVSPEGPDDIELLLEPNDNPAAKTYQKAIFEQGIPSTSFAVEDIQKEYERMKNLGVKTRYVTWRWLDKRLNVWDKWTGDIRVASKISIVIMNLNSKWGRAWKTGSEITDPDELQRALDYGYETWMNDSYWVFMPFKLKDPGVILEYISEGEIEGSPVDILGVTFKNVGKTPENKYHIYVDKESKLLVWWDYYMDAADEQPRFKMPWKNYQKYGDIWLSDDRGLRKHTDLAVFEELPDSVFQSFERLDLVKLIEQKTL